MGKTFQIISFLFFICMASSSYGQNEELANEYFNNGEFEKALLYLEDIYKKRPAANIYEKYLACLKETEQFDEAEKLVKRHMKRYKNKPELLLDLGDLYKEQGNESEARNYYDEAKSKVGENRAQVSQLANAFTKRSMLEDALETYNIGKTKLKDNYFNFQIANRKQ